MPTVGIRQTGRCAYSASWRQVHPSALHQVAPVTQYSTDVCRRYAWRLVTDYTWARSYLESIYTFSMFFSKASWYIFQKLSLDPKIPFWLISLINLINLDETPECSQFFTIILKAIEKPSFVFWWFLSSFNINSWYLEEDVVRIRLHQKT